MEKEYRINFNEVFGWLKRSQESLKLAQVSLQNGWYPRTISQSYYVMYYAAYAAVLSQTIPASLKSHSGLHTLFSKYLIKTKKLPTALSSKLAVTFEMRQIADYSLKEDFHFRDARKAVNEAENFLNIVTKFINSLKPIK